MTTRTEDFERHRPLLFSIAYRMLGSVADAEDVVQEVYLRWQGAPETEVRSPRSYLSAAVTRLSIDRLRSARAWREEYVGPWLPEPLLSDRAEEVAAPSELEESLSMAFLALLESLNNGSTLSRGEGVTEEQFPGLEQSKASSPLEELVLRYAAALTRTPAVVQDELFDELESYLAGSTTPSAWGRKDSWRAPFTLCPEHPL